MLDAMTSQPSPVACHAAPSRMSRFTRVLTFSVWRSLKK
jgi:hypothetical protein